MQFAKLVKYNSLKKISAQHFSLNATAPQFWVTFDIHVHQINQLNSVSPVFLHAKRCQNPNSS